MNTLARWRFNATLRRLGHSPRWVTARGSWSAGCRNCSWSWSGRGTRPVNLAAAVRATDTCQRGRRRSGRGR